MLSLSRETIFWGIGAWSKALPEIKKVSKRPMLLGRSLATKKIIVEYDHHQTK